MPDADTYRHKLADFLRLQPATQGLTHEDVAQATTRDELGISSLNVILLIAEYIKSEAGGRIALQPEWVSRLETIDGIISVIQEIDETSLAEAPA
jgi:hypothetical protein